jgi:hypothetical protein
MKRHRRDWHEIVGVGPGFVVTSGPARSFSRSLLRWIQYAVIVFFLGVLAFGPLPPILWNLVQATFSILLGRT